MGSKGRKNVKKPKLDKAKKEEAKKKQCEISIMGFPDSCYYRSN